MSKKEKQTLLRPDFGDVLARMIATVPPNHDRLLRQLNKIKNEWDSKPEDVWVTITATVLEEYLKEFDWVKEVRTIFYKLPDHGKS